jgi:uncharacterized protein involved in outer membrane biogenesis
MSDRAGTHDREKSVASKDGFAAGESAAILEEKTDRPIVSRSHWRRRAVLAGGLIVLVAAFVVLPPLINIGRYQRRVAVLMSQSLGRPVHMSSVELRLLPRPGFVLHDLSVSEDPEFGSEPILSAQTVVASIRMLSLWRGRLEIDRVSVDVASLNLVRSAQGRWNLDSLIMSAQPALTGHGANANLGKQTSGSSANFPYLEATDSRVNLKNGIEKSPYSLIGTDLSLWQDEPGHWRVRLRGQPVRTDMEMSSADTGEVRMEATLRSARLLREMPISMQMEWRDAQLGQLSRLLLGADAGWRGDVTADVNIEGTADAAQTKARLRVTGVRREEFTPETPLDFDANCSFRYQHSQAAVHDIGCDTAIGNGQLHLKAELPGNTGLPEAMLEAKDVPVQAGLDLLRTVRSGFAPRISAKGTVNGSLSYQQPAIEEKTGVGKKLAHSSRTQKLSPKDLEANSELAKFHGALTLEGVQLRGGELKEPLTLPRITLAPVLLPRLVNEPTKSTTRSIVKPASTSGSSLGLGTQFTVVFAHPPEPSQQTARRVGSQATTKTDVTPPVSSSQTIHVRLAIDAQGYDAIVGGSAEPAKVRELAYASGLPHLDAADGFSGGAADFDLSASGPWIASSEIPASSSEVAAASQSSPVPANEDSGNPLQAARPKKSTPVSSAPSAVLPAQEAVSGSLQLHHTQWKSSYLALPVDMGQAAVTFSDSKITLTSDFSYGISKEPAKESPKEPVKESAPESASEPAADAVARTGDTSATAGNSVPANPAPGNSVQVNSIRGSVVVTASTRCGASGGENSSPGSPASGCVPQVQLRFGALDAAQIEAALLGAPEQKTLLSPLIDRMRSTDKPKWPEVMVSAQADSLILGPATLQKPTVHLRLKSSEVAIENWETELLGGSAKGTGHFAWTGDKPEYSLDGNLTRINAAFLGTLLDTHWSGGLLNGSGSVHLTGLTAKELGSSASGQLHFDWTHGTLSVASQEVHFDDWSGAIAIQGGKAQVGENTMLAGRRSSAVAATIPWGGPVKLSITPSSSKQIAHAGQAASLPAAK